MSKAKVCSKVNNAINWDDSHQPNSGGWVRLHQVIEMAPIHQTNGTQWREILNGGERGGGQQLGEGDVCELTGESLALGYNGLPLQL